VHKHVTQFQLLVLKQQLPWCVLQGGTVQLNGFVEDVAVPMVQLVYDDPAIFAQQLMDDSLRSVMAAAAAAHPDCTLSVGVIGLDSWAQKEDNKSLKQVRHWFPWRC
jgi:hypothetical protein